MNFESLFNLVKLNDFTSNMLSFTATLEPKDFLSYNLIRVLAVFFNVTNSLVRTLTSAAWAEEEYVGFLNGPVLTNALFACKFETCLIWLIKQFENVHTEKCLVISDNGLEAAMATL